MLSIPKPDTDAPQLTPLGEAPIPRPDVVVTCWRAVCIDAKLGKVRLHDLRRTAASHAVMSGENLPLVGKLVGHRRHSTTASYAHLADIHLVETAERVGSLIAQAMNLHMVPAAFPSLRAPLARALDLKSIPMPLATS